MPEKAYYISVRKLSRRTQGVLEPFIHRESVQYNHIAEMT